VTISSPEIPAGSVYVTDIDGRSVTALDPNGLELVSWGEHDGQAAFDVPARIAAAPDGTLYLSVFEEHRIYHLDAQGRQLAVWGSFGDEPGQLRWPEGVAISAAGDVFVADTGNNRIQKFSPEGTYQYTWGLPGDAEGFFNRPTGIAARHGMVTVLAAASRDAHREAHLEELAELGAKLARVAWNRH